jgi:hypothetical protein
MTKPVTPQDMFDLWQKMVNPSAYPLQSLMFPVMDPDELEKKIAELQAVEHWLRANLSMLQLSIKSLEYQRALLKGGEKMREAMQGDAGAAGAPDEPPNPAMWAWNMMARAGKDAMEAAQAATQAPDPPPPRPRKRRKPKAA